MIPGLQLQLKSPTQASQHPIHASTPQTLQLQGLTVDPSKLTVLQELPEVGKVVVQETKPNTDSITTILEEMKVLYQIFIKINHRFSNFFSFVIWKVAKRIFFITLGPSWFHSRRRWIQSIYHSLCCRRNRICNSNSGCCLFSCF